LKSKELLPKPKGVKQLPPLYFSVNCEGIMGIARQAYWYEGYKRQAWARELLHSFPLTDEQIEKVLNGDAKLVGIARREHSTARYVETEDVPFKKKLVEQKKFLAEAYVEIAGRRIDSAIWKQYSEGIVKRLRAAMKNPGLMASDPIAILELEHERQRLHEYILALAGFKDKRSRKSHAFHKFQSALSARLDQEAGQLGA
jgi:hypothetical protein